MGPIPERSLPGLGRALCSGVKNLRQGLVLLPQAVPHADRAAWTEAIG